MDKVRQTRFIGFDIGATWFRAAAFSDDKLRAHWRCRTPRTHAGLLRAVVRALKAVKYRGAEPVGVAAACRVDGPLLAACQNAPGLGGFDFRILPMVVTVENDARAWLTGALGGMERPPACVLGITIGTGIGRAVARRGSVIAEKALERAEAWEPEYQKLRRSPELAVYLAWQLRKLLDKYKPQLLLVGGGVADKRPELTGELRREIARYMPKLKVRAVKNSDRLGCWGAARVASRCD